jgi:hypothetical protein
MNNATTDTMSRTNEDITTENGYSSTDYTNETTTGTSTAETAIGTAACCTISTMTTTTQKPRNAKASYVSKSDERKAQKGMIDDAVQTYEKALQLVNGTGKQVSKSTFKNIAKVFGNPNWMNRHTIQNHHIKWKNSNSNNNNNNNNNPPEEITVGDNNNTEGQISELSNNSSQNKIRNKGGRPSESSTLITCAEVQEYSY